MKHRTLAILLALTLTVSLAACGKDGGDGPAADGSAPSDSASPEPSDSQQPSPAPSDSAPVEAPSDEPSDEPSGAPSDEPSAAPADTVSPSPAPSQSASPSPSPSPSTAPEQGGGVDLAAFAQGLTEDYEISGFLKRMDPDDEGMGAPMLDGYFPGLREMDLAQMEVYLCMISFNTGEFSLVEAKSADDAAKVKDIFQARIDSMVEEGVNYPETIEQWQNNAKVVVNGNYVMLVCAEDCDAIVADFDALF